MAASGPGGVLLWGSSSDELRAGHLQLSGHRRCPVPPASSGAPAVSLFPLLARFPGTPGPGQLQAAPPSSAPMPPGHVEAWWGGAGRQCERLIPQQTFNSFAHLFMSVRLLVSCFSQWIIMWVIIFYFDVQKGLAGAPSCWGVCPHHSLSISLLSGRKKVFWANLVRSLAQAWNWPFLKGRA